MRDEELTEWYCPYWDKTIDCGLCYEVHAVMNCILKASAVPEVESWSEIQEYCQNCVHTDF